MMKFHFPKVFPDYDFSWTDTNMRELAGHHDAQVSSSLLNVTIEFKWRPYLEDGLSELITWTSPNAQAPNWLIMGLWKYTN
jgi:hypothetical protein